MLTESRIDKWLWLVRLCKTRSQATEAVNGGKFKLNGMNIKPARNIVPGDRIEFRKGPIIRIVEVLGIPSGRIPAKEVPLYYNDLTPESELAKLEQMKWVKPVKRDKGAGRPTKKDRRDLGRMGLD